MIIVSGLSQAQSQIDRHAAKSVIGVLGPETPHPTYRGIDAKRHLRLTFNDINEETDGMTAATADDAARLVEFIKAWDRREPMLIHCWAGISRSTASAFAALCILNPEADEMELAKKLRRASPSATPNRLITTRVDLLLGRQGRMLRAVESIGRGANAFESEPFLLEI
jgi:predicted protein tyrosine phosphatase